MKRPLSITLAAMRLNGAPTPVLMSNLAAAYNKLTMYVVSRVRKLVQCFEQLSGMNTRTMQPERLSSTILV